MELLKQLDELKALKASLSEEIAKYAENDPELLAAMGLFFIQSILPFSSSITDMFCVKQNVILSEQLKVRIAGLTTCTQFVNIVRHTLTWQAASLIKHSRSQRTLITCSDIHLNHNHPIVHSHTHTFKMPLILSPSILSFISSDLPLRAHME